MFQPPRTQRAQQCQAGICGHWWELELSGAAATAEPWQPSQQDFTPGNVALLGVSSTAAGGFTLPSTSEERRYPPVLGWPGGTGSTGAQERCKIGVPGVGQRQKEHLTSAFPFGHWLLSPSLPQVSLIRTSTVPMASILVWADIQYP